MDWRDRPIRHGDRFIPLGPCRVSSSANVWAFEPEGPSGGRWERVALTLIAKDAPIDVPAAGWSRYERIVWNVDGSTYRLRVGADEPRVHLTGAVEDVEGEWSSEG
jgi:hypothetical protein